MHREPVWLHLEVAEVSDLFSLRLKILVGKSNKTDKLQVSLWEVPGFMEFKTNSGANKVLNNKQTDKKNE
jgi:hypothetical protein